VCVCVCVYVCVCVCVCVCFDVCSELCMLNAQMTLSLNSQEAGGVYCNSEAESVSLCHMARLHADQVRVCVCVCVRVCVCVCVCHLRHRSTPPRKMWCCRLWCCRLETKKTAWKTFLSSK